jgi:hypothetical protein
MTLVENVEKRIWDVEEFGVIIRHEDGRDVRGDRTGIPMYDLSRKAKDSMTVSAWIDQRFRPKYPGYRVEVLDGYGSPAVGNTLLSTVRESYSK